MSVIQSLIDVLVRPANGMRLYLPSRDEEIRKTGESENRNRIWKEERGRRCLSGTHGGFEGGEAVVKGGEDGFHGVSDGLALEE